LAAYERRFLLFLVLGRVHLSISFQVNYNNIEHSLFWGNNSFNPQLARRPTATTTHIVFTRISVTGSTEFSNEGEL
jgi:hypothetical protein